MGRVTTRVPARRYTAGSAAIARPETIVVEEPLEVRVDAQSVVVTMRTPGDDVDLAFGLLLAEGVINDPQEIRNALHCQDTGPDGRPTFNVLELSRQPGLPPVDLSGRRTFGMSSACGVCGAAVIDAIRTRQRLPEVAGDPTRIPVEMLIELPDRMRPAQAVFARTGGLHAAALFTPAGDLVCVREDVGRHNAADKAIGHAARTLGWPLPPLVLMLSGRASFELVQKAWVAGLPIAAAVSAASSMAVEVAETAGITLAGFVRPPKVVCYTRPDRLMSGSVLA